MTASEASAKAISGSNVTIVISKEGIRTLDSLTRAVVHNIFIRNIAFTTSMEKSGSHEIFGCITFDERLVCVPAVRTCRATAVQPLSSSARAILLLILLNPSQERSCCYVYNCVAGQASDICRVCAQMVFSTVYDHLSISPSLPPSPIPPQLLTENPPGPREGRGGVQLGQRSL